MKKYGMRVKEILALCESSDTFKSKTSKKCKLAFVKAYKKIERNSLISWKKYKKCSCKLYLWERGHTKRSERSRYYVRLKKVGI